MPNHFENGSKPNKMLALLLVNLRCKLLHKVLPLVKDDDRLLHGLQTELGHLYKRE